MQYTEAMVDVFEESMDKMEATDLETNPEAMETIVERRKLRNEEAEVDTIRVLEG
jgi:hypothetical protein